MKYLFFIYSVCLWSQFWHIGTPWRTPLFLYREIFLGDDFDFENANNIGGDANRISILGESSGSESVSLHLLSDTCNTIAGAIQQSGTAVFGRMTTSCSSIFNFKKIHYLFCPPVRFASRKTIKIILGSLRITRKNYQRAARYNFFLHFSLAVAYSSN